MSQKTTIKQAETELVTAIFDPLCEKWNTTQIPEIVVPASKFQAWLHTEVATKTLYIMLGCSLLLPQLTINNILFLASTIIMLGTTMLAAGYRQLVLDRHIGTTLTYNKKHYDGRLKKSSIWLHCSKRWGHIEMITIEELLQQGVLPEHITQAVNAKFLAKKDKDKKRLNLLTDALQGMHTADILAMNNEKLLIEHEILKQAHKELVEAGVRDYSNSQLRTAAEQAAYQHENYP